MSQGEPGGNWTVAKRNQADHPPVARGVRRRRSLTHKIEVRGTARQ